MNYNSLDYALFVPIVFILYWFIFSDNLKVQNLLILVASYVFYGWWDYRFLTLIVLSSGVDFMVGIGLGKYRNAIIRKWLLYLSLTANLGMLGIFKYYNFFIISFSDALNSVGWDISPDRLNVVLPVGISFYTFQTLSYTIDVYFKRIEHAKDPIAFFAFVSFFPQLVAGPIERASKLLPQFMKHRTFNYGKAVDGLRQILWGLFKKVVIADNCAVVANNVFNNYGDYSGMILIIGALLFSFQIYADFSGYSDIAIGTARLFGFDLMRNFAFPYFSRDIAEFWRRWHISLSTWFRDYVYIPIGGSRGSKIKKVRNIFVIFLVSGLWHGANWTFIVWGLINALYFLPLLMRNRNRIHTDTVAEGYIIPTFKEIFQMGTTFAMVTIAWVFFRADSIREAYEYINRMFSFSTLVLTQLDLRLMRRMTAGTDIVIIFIFVFILIIIEWLQRDKSHALQFESNNINNVFRWGIYYTLIFVIFWYGGSQQSFIYFQF